MKQAGGIVIPYMEANEICRIMRRTVPKIEHVCVDFKRKSANKKYNISDARRRSLLKRCKSNIPGLKRVIKDKC